MLNASNPTAGYLWPAAAPLSAPAREGDALFLLALRYAAHLPYFKIASAMLLPQGLGTGGVLVTVLAYALACSAASRWIAGQRRARSQCLSQPAVLPLLGTTAVLLAMLAMGPTITTLLPRHPELAAASPLALLPAWLALLAPVTLGFLAAQLLTGRRFAKA